MLVLTDLIPEPVELVEASVQQPPQLLRPLLLHGHLDADESPSDDPSDHFLITNLPLFITALVLVSDFTWNSLQWKL